MRVLNLIGIDKQAEELARTAASLLVYQHVLRGRPAQAFLKVLLNLQKVRMACVFCSARSADWRSESPKRGRLQPTSVIFSNAGLHASAAGAVLGVLHSPRHRGHGFLGGLHSRPGACCCGQKAFDVAGGDVALGGVC